MGATPLAASGGGMIERVGAETDARARVVCKSMTNADWLTGALWATSIAPE
jgi:hypothetical protein